MAENENTTDASASKGTSIAGSEASHGEGADTSAAASHGEGTDTANATGSATDEKGGDGVTKSLEDAGDYIENNPNSKEDAGPGETND